MKVTTVVKFYAVSFSFAIMFWGFLVLCQVEFPSIVFFLTAYVWHLALVTPGLKEKVLKENHKFSFLSVIVRINHYLQMLVNFKKAPFATSFIRAISPVLFTFVLFMIGGTGNILFTILGSFCFEVIYLIVKNKTEFYAEPALTPSVNIKDLDIPPVIPNEEISHE